MRRWMPVKEISILTEVLPQTPFSLSVYYFPSQTLHSRPVQQGKAAPLSSSPALSVVQREEGGEVD